MLQREITQLCTLGSRGNPSAGIEDAAAWSSRNLDRNAANEDPLAIQLQMR